MGRKNGKQKTEEFRQALSGKSIPVLTVDNKWYRLLREVDKVQVKKLEDELNSLLKRQGKLTTEAKDIKKLKRKLMGEIMPLMEEAEKNERSDAYKQVEQNRRLIEECNEKLEEYQDELLELPREIDRVNMSLMLLTMELCYDAMQSNTEKIQKIAGWAAQMRIELKKQLVLKQEMEQKNYAIYSYMHDIFGADVVNLFEMKYNPESKQTSKSNNEKK